MFVGSVIAFLNLPAHLSAVLFEWDSSLDLLRYILLFIVSGASCGAWIGWQAYRAENPQAGFFPPCSLKTLLGVVLAWGALLALFIRH
mgnify:CR=1 FL=1